MTAFPYLLLSYMRKGFLNTLLVHIELPVSIGNDLFCFPLNDGVPTEVQRETLVQKVDRQHKHPFPRGIGQPFGVLELCN